MFFWIPPRTNFPFSLKKWRIPDIPRSLKKNAHSSVVCSGNVLRLCHQRSEWTPFDWSEGASCKCNSRYRQPFLASRGNPYLTVNIPVFNELDPLILWTRVVKFYMAIKTKSSVSTLCCLILCSFVDADNICHEKYPLLLKKVPWRRTRRPYLCCQFRQCMNFSPKRVCLTSNRSTNSFVEEMGHSSSSLY